MEATEGFKAGQLPATSSGDRVISERVLTPIPGAKPAGEDLRGLRDWVEIRAARPKAGDSDEKHDWQPANPVKTDWGTYKGLVEEALCTRSKDLELGMFLAEASARVDGFAGVRDGLWTIRHLLVEFRGRGLFPQAEDGNLEDQFGPLDWLNEKLADVIREIPITMRPSPAVNYSLNYRDESLRQNGMITGIEFEAAATAGSVEQYQALQTLLQETRTELHALDRVTVEHFGAGAVSFEHSKQAIGDCGSAIESILRKRSPARVVPTCVNGSQPPAAPTSPGMPMVVGTPPADLWAEAERLAGKGDVDHALSVMAGLAAAESNGRVRFQRKLLLADICLQTNRKKLGRSILEELNEVVESHNLARWESSEMVGAVWSRLVRCYRDTSAGTADASKEAEFFHKLSRLDPWQAVACGELNGKE